MGLFTRLGDRVDHWLTINETKIIVQQGYRYGRMAPGKTDPRCRNGDSPSQSGPRSRRHAFRAAKAKGRIGPVCNLPRAIRPTRASRPPRRPRPPPTENTLYLDPLLKVVTGPQPTGQQQAPAYGQQSNGGPGQRQRSGRLPRGQLLLTRRGRQSRAGAPAPSGLCRRLAADLSAWALRHAYQDSTGYGAEVMITENGVPDDARDSSRPTIDDARVEFLEQHLRAVHQAITDGCRVTGYHAWSLLDNFEWAASTPSVGELVRVDFDTLHRTPKGSASWYSAVAAGNQVPPK